MVELLLDKPEKKIFLSVYFYNVIISEGHKRQLSPNIYFST